VIVFLINHSFGGEMENTTTAEKPKVNRGLILFGTMLVQIGVGTFYAWALFNNILLNKFGQLAYAVKDAAGKAVVLPHSVSAVDKKAVINWAVSQGILPNATDTAAIAKHIVAASAQPSLGPVSMIFTIGALALSLSTIIAPMLVKKFGVRWTVLVSGILLGLSILGGSILANPANAGGSGSLPMYYLLMGVVLGATDGIAYIATLSNIIKWFPERTGLAAGLSVACYGLGSFIIKYIDTFVGKASGSFSDVILGKASVAAANLGKTWMIWGILVIVLIVLASFLLKDAPESPKVAAGDESPEAAAKENFTGAETLRTPQAYLMFVALFAAAFAFFINGIISSAGGSMAGMDTATAANLVAYAAIANMIGRFTMGALSDKIGRKGVFFITYTLSLLSVLVLIMNLGALNKGAAPMNAGLFTLVALVIVFCFGGNITVFPTWVGDYFGLKNHTRNYSIVYQGFGFGLLAGSILQSADKNSYPILFWTMAILLVVSLAIFIFIKAPKKAA
jgi:OFA family oxalate/formate antiporter-like MFS transporter